MGSQFSFSSLRRNKFGLGSYRYPLFFMPLLRLLITQAGKETLSPELRLGTPDDVKMPTGQIVNFQSPASHLLPNLPRVTDTFFCLEQNNGAIVHLRCVLL